MVWIFFLDFFELFDVLKWVLFLFLGGKKDIVKMEVMYVYCRIFEEFSKDKRMRKIV